MVCGGDFFMLGFLMAALAGAAMSVQGVMNTRLSEKIGLLESNAYVQGTAFVLSALAMWFFGKGNLKLLPSVPWPYWLGGAVGLVITITVMLAIHELNATLAISTILIAQLLVAAAIDYFGIMESEKTPFGIQKFIALALMIGSVVLFKWEPK